MFQWRTWNNGCFKWSPFGGGYAYVWKGFALWNASIFFMFSRCAVCALRHATETARIKKKSRNEIKKPWNVEVTFESWYVFLGNCCYSVQCWISIMSVSGSNKVLSLNAIVFNIWLREFFILFPKNEFLFRSKYMEWTVKTEINFSNSLSIASFMAQICE